MFFRIPLLTTVALAAGTLLVPPAAAVDLIFTGTTAGPALTPWTGQIEGTVEETGYDYVGGTRQWLREGRLVATPPVPEEDWIPAATRNSHAMYQLVKFVVDRCLSVDGPPSILGQSTGNDYVAAVTVTNDAYGIEIGCLATSNGAEGLVEGQFDVFVAAPFPFCTNAYVTTGVVMPLGPGAAAFDGNVHLDLVDGSSMDLAMHIDYSFDPAVELPGAFELVEEAVYEIVEDPDQALIVTETLRERPLAPFPGAQVSFTGSIGGAALPAWEGTVEGAIEVFGLTHEADIRCWTRAGNLVATPPFPEVDWHPLSIYKLVPWIIKCVADQVAGIGHPLGSGFVGELAGNDYCAHLTAQIPDAGLVLSFDAQVGPGQPVQTTGEFALTIETPFPPMLPAYAAHGTLTPAGPDTTRNEGTVLLLLEDGTELELILDGYFCYTGHETEVERVEYAETANWEIFEGGQQVMYVVDEYCEEEFAATAVSPAVAQAPRIVGVQPNPFNPRATVVFALPAPQSIELAIFTVDGRRVATLIDAPRPAGEQRAVWDGRDDQGRRVASGVYLCRLVAGGDVSTTRLALMK